MAIALVIENDPLHDARRLGRWLTEADLELHVLRPYAGDDLPAELTGYDALVVLPGVQSVNPAPGGALDAPWLPAVEGLLRKAVRNRTATLAIGLGAQLLATAHAGFVEPAAAGPQIGPGLVGKRDAADDDPLFRVVPLMPDVLQWHCDEITELPQKATLLAAGTRVANQAFRMGHRAWGLIFHIECDPAMIAEWASADSALLDRLDYDPDLVTEVCAAALGDIEEAWQPFAARFAELARGELADGSPRRNLPLLGQ
ncbi:type 1 glutamine amidotransferase [Micromonosporaceae bacterium DT55]|uniref:type 1 glutamine amidotransferase n=1 Tax=Melissospora conviva TaxID=3388432 RepID=UPI003C132B63